MKRWYPLAVLFAFDFAAFVMLDAGWAVIAIMMASIGGALSMQVWNEVEF